MISLVMIIASLKELIYLPSSISLLVFYCYVEWVFYFYRTGVCCSSAEAVQHFTCFSSAYVVK